MTVIISYAADSIGRQTFVVIFVVKINHKAHKECIKITKRLIFYINTVHGIV